MTTYTDFTPTAAAPFSFQPTLDGAVYTVMVKWNLFGQRWYVHCYDLNGVLQFCLPLIASPAGYDISLSQGFFTSTLVYREATAQFEVTP